MHAQSGTAGALLLQNCIMVSATEHAFAVLIQAASFQLFCWISGILKMPNRLAPFHLLGNLVALHI